MKLKINAIHFELSSDLEKTTQDKVASIEKYLDKIISAEVTMKADKTSDKKKTVSLRLDVPGHDLFAEKEGEVFEKALDAAVEAVKVQIQKYKEKQKK